MKQKFIFLLLFIGVLGLIFGVFKLVGSKKNRQGVLKISSIPVSSVFLDNKNLGKSPYEDKVNEGEYNLKLIPESATESYSSWQGKVTISPNLLTYVNAELSESEFTSAVDILWLEKITSNNPELSVITNPDGASVTVDGESKGITPLTLTNVSGGDHTVVVSSPGFATRTVKVKTTSGYKLIVNMKLALSSILDVENIDESTDSAIIDEDELSSPSADLSPSTEEDLSDKDEEDSFEKPYIIISETPTGFLRVRMGPTTSATQAATVDPGDKFTVLKEENGWYQINYSKDDEESIGWVSGTYAEIVE